jgi:hypothetical protein
MKTPCPHEKAKPDSRRPLVRVKRKQSMPGHPELKNTQTEEWRGFNLAGLYHPYALVPLLHTPRKALEGRSFSPDQQNSSIGYNRTAISATSHRNPKLREKSKGWSFKKN